METMVALYRMTSVCAIALVPMYQIKLELHKAEKMLLSLGIFINITM